MNAQLRIDAGSVAVSSANAKLGFDVWLLLSAGALLYVGLMMIASASTPIAESHFANPFHYVARHGVYLCLALAAAGAVSQVKVSWWLNNGWLLLFVSLALLTLVLIIGRKVNGSVRWIGLGPINMQPSEIAKLFLLGYLAGYLVRRREEVLVSWWGFVKPNVVMFVAATLLLMEPDFGATVVILAASIGMIFLSGARVGKFMALMAVCSVLATLLVIWKPYRMERLISYLNPWKDQYDTGYQLTQALIAFGRGEWSGLGLGQSIQKMSFLPEAHTDFVFAIIGEEFGLIGTFIVVALFAVLVYRGMRIGKQAETLGLLFNALFAYGISLLIGIQAFINIGVNTGLLPTKGLTLPLISYGGSSLIMSCICVAILYRVDQENRLEVSAQSAQDGKKTRQVRHMRGHDQDRRCHDQERRCHD